MTTAREMVAAQIRQDHSSWDVRAYPYVPTNVTTKKPVVAVWRTDLSPGSNSTKLRHPVTVNLYGSKTAGDAVEEELDGLLDEVMLSLQRLDHFTWETAARTTWKDTISGWQITGYMEPNNTYASIVRAERETPNAS
jgi:hypothetical protein